jgi:regulatory protein
MSGANVSAYERALRLLGQRQHFRGDLRRKLLAKGYEAEEVDAALERCAAEGYLDDETTARAFVDERQRRRGLGSARIAAELRRRGASSSAVSAALAEVDPEADVARARAAAAKWRRRRAGASRSPTLSVGEDDALRRRAENAALARHLERKGFGRRAIVAVLAEAGTSSDVDLDDAAPAD